MKKILFILSILLTFSFSLMAQKSCKVLVPELAGTYKGKCKNGLAHGKGLAVGTDRYEGKFNAGLPNGKGTYTWANGDVYRGNWKEGHRDGEGTLTLKLASGDSIMSGLWEADKYMGPKPIAPKVIAKVSIDRYKFINQAGVKNRVLIDFYQNGSRNNDITNLLMNASNGVQCDLGQSIGYDYIEFPVRIKVSYLTKNKLKSATFQAIFEFEITEPGDWQVEIHN